MGVLLNNTRRGGVSKEALGSNVERCWRGPQTLTNGEYVGGVGQRPECACSREDHEWLGDNGARSVALLVLGAEGDLNGDLSLLGVPVDKTAASSNMSM